MVTTHSHLHFSALALPPIGECASRGGSVIAQINSALVVDADAVSRAHCSRFEAAVSSRELEAGLPGGQSGRGKSEEGG